MTLRSAALALAVGGTGCGSLKTALSITTYTSVSCESCRLPFVALGQPLEIGFDWPTGDAADDPTLHWTIECTGGPCHVADQDASEARGVGYARVVPDAVALITVHVSITDGIKRQDFSYGPIRVIAADRVEAACMARRPATAAYHPCLEGVYTGDDVRIEASAWGGADRLPADTIDLAVEGQPVPARWRNPEAGNDPDTGWICGASFAAAGGGPALACMAYDVSPGDHVVAAHYGTFVDEARFTAGKPPTR